jgi:hypothetical protein
MFSLGILFVTYKVAAKFAVVSVTVFLLYLKLGDILYYIEQFVRKMQNVSQISWSKYLLVTIPSSVLENILLVHQAGLIIEEYFLLGYNAVYSAEIQPTFRKNMSPVFLRNVG